MSPLTHWRRMSSLKEQQVTLKVPHLISVRGLHGMHIQTETVWDVTSTSFNCSGGGQPLVCFNLTGKCGKSLFAFMKLILLLYIQIFYNFDNCCTGWQYNSHSNQSDNICTILLDHWTPKRPGDFILILISAAKDEDRTINFFIKVFLEPFQLKIDATAEQLLQLQNFGHNSVIFVDI